VTVDAPHASESRIAYEDTSWNSLVPSEEIQQFASAAREHFASIFSPADIRNAFSGAALGGSLWAEIVEQGYTAVGLREELDGDGTLSDVVAILEVAGGSLVPEPLLASVAAVQTLVAANAATEGMSEHPASIVVLGPEESAEGRVSVFDGRFSTRLAVLRDRGSEVELDWFELTNATASLESRAAVDPSRAYASVDLERANRLVHERLPISIDQALAAARVCVSADLVGVASASLDLSLGHVLARQQFGRPLGAFQALKHMLADVYVDIERARSLTFGAAAAVTKDPRGESARHLSMLAKATSAEIAIRAAAIRVQLMGAMGLTFEADAHLYVRRAQQTARFLGNPADLYVTVAGDRLAGDARVD